MPQTIKPFVGQRATFVPNVHDGEKPTHIAAQVVKVWSDTCVNLRCADGSEPTSVFVFDRGASHVEPAGYYCVLAADECFMQPKITGYRQLSASEAALMNKIKEAGAHLGSLVAELRSIGATPPNSAPVPTDDWHGTSVDQRWVSIGATHLQEGLMALTRGVAQPTSF